MPIYEYECENCRARLEIIQRANDPQKKKCPKCGGKLKKRISAPAIHFKGKGWYITDYAKKSGSSSESPQPKPVKSSSVKKDGDAPSSDKDEKSKP
jgi:putative FmdB family regulatory protein